MFVIVEFNEKDCALIPIIWLTENGSQCYWPSVRSDDAFNKLVQARTPPKDSWPVHPIKKVLRTIESYEEACNALTKLLEEITSSEETDPKRMASLSTNLIVPFSLSKKRKHSIFDNRETGEMQNAKIAKTGTFNRQNDNGKSSTSTSSISSEEIDPKIMASLPTNPNLVFCLNNKKRKHTALDNNNKEARIDETSTSQTDNDKNNTSLTFNTMLTRANNEHHDSFLEPLTPASTVTVRSSRASTPLNSASSQTFCDSVISKIETLATVQGQHTLAINEILRLVRASGSQRLIEPEDFPHLPLNRKKEFKDFENYITISENFNFVKQRLALVGGFNVRNTTMNILKTILSNKLAMKYNWSGRDKKSFKETQTMRLIYEAVRYAFEGMLPSDLSDKTIGEAVKAWLKLAKQRYSYQCQK